MQKRIDASPEFIFQTPPIPPLSHLPALEFVSMTNYTATMSVELVALEALFDNPAVKVIQIRDGINWLKWRGTRLVRFCRLVPWPLLLCSGAVVLIAGWCSAGAMCVGRIADKLDVKLPES